MPTRKLPASSLRPAVEELVENLLAPELFATATPSFSVAGGVLTISFASSRVDNSADPRVRKQVIVARVSMPIASGADLAMGLYDVLVKSGVNFETQPTSVSLN